MKNQQNNNIWIYIEDERGIKYKDWCVDKNWCVDSNTVTLKEFKNEISSALSRKYNNIEFVVSKKNIECYLTADNSLLKDQLDDQDFKKLSVYVEVLPQENNQNDNLIEPTIKIKNRQTKAVNVGQQKVALFSPVKKQKNNYHQIISKEEQKNNDHEVITNQTTSYQHNSNKPLALVCPPRFDLYLIEKNDSYTLTVAKKGSGKNNLYQMPCDDSLIIDFKPSFKLLAGHLWGDMYKDYKTHQEEAKKELKELLKKIETFLLNKSPKKQDKGKGRRLTRIDELNAGLNTLILKEEAKDHLEKKSIIKKKKVIIRLPKSYVKYIPLKNLKEINKRSQTVQFYIPEESEKKYFKTVGPVNNFFNAYIMDSDNVINGKAYKVLIEVLIRKRNSIIKIEFARLKDFTRTLDSNYYIWGVETIVFNFSMSDSPNPQEVILYPGARIDAELLAGIKKIEQDLPHDYPVEKIINMHELCHIRAMKGGYKYKRDSGYFLNNPKKWEDLIIYLYDHLKSVETKAGTYTNSPIMRVLTGLKKSKNTYSQKNKTFNTKFDTKEKIFNAVGIFFDGKVDELKKYCDEQCFDETNEILEDLTGPHNNSCIIYKFFNNSSSVRFRKYHQIKQKLQRLPAKRDATI